MNTEIKDNEIITRGILKLEIRSAVKEALKEADLVTRKEMKEEFENFAVIINGAFSTQQKYIDMRFDEVDKKFERLESKMDLRFAAVHTRIDNLSSGSVQFKFP